MNNVCPRCLAAPGSSCRTPKGKACEPHKARIDSAEQAAQLAAQVEAIVPAIAAPVRQLKERFTLSGDPLPISKCMKMLGLTIEKPEAVNGPIFCHFPQVKDTCFSIVRNGDNWGLAKYKAEDPDVTDVPATEADVLEVLIRRYYRLNSKRRPADIVLKSLSARLVQVATTEQVDSFRSRLKAEFQPRARA